MNFWIFSVVTIVGSALWCAVLAYLGDKAYHAAAGSHLESRRRWCTSSKRNRIWIVLVVAVLAFFILLMLRLIGQTRGRSVAEALQLRVHDSIHKCQHRIARRAQTSEHFERFHEREAI